MTTSPAQRRVPLAGEPIRPHAQSRDILMSHAGRMVREGDRLQASEKVWGAIAHALQVVADARGWPYASHADAEVLIRHLARLTKNRRFVHLFSAVNDLHANYYLDVLPMDEIKARREDGKSLIALLKEANWELPREAAPPSPQEKKYWERAAARDRRTNAYAARGRRSGALAPPTR